MIHKFVTKIAKYVFFSFDTRHFQMCVLLLLFENEFEK